MISSWDLQRSLIFGGQQPLELCKVSKGVSEWIRNTKKPMIWYLTWLTMTDFKFWPQVIDIWRSNALKIIWGQKGGLEWRRNTYKPMIWHLTWLIFIVFIFWPPEVRKFWRLRPSGSSEVKMGYQNGIRTPKNLWFETSLDLFSLILYFDLHR